MDGLTDFKTATTEELPDAVAVMDPFRVVRLAGDALDRCRRRIQLVTCGHRGRKSDPLYSARRTLHTGNDLLTDKQKARLDELPANEKHIQVEVTWGTYQQMITVYREPDRAAGSRPPTHASTNRVARQRRPEGARARYPRPHPEQASRRRARLLRPTQHQQWTHRSHQRPTRAPPRLRPRLTQPHQLHHQIPTRNRRTQTPITPSTGMSRICPYPKGNPAADAQSVSLQRKRLGASRSAEIPLGYCGSSSFRFSTSSSPRCVKTYSSPLRWTRFLSSSDFSVRFMFARIGARAQVCNSSHVAPCVPRQ